jgi:hypothetical protein
LRAPAEGPGRGFGCRVSRRAVVGLTVLPVGAHVAGHVPDSLSDGPPDVAAIAITLFSQRFFSRDPKTDGFTAERGACIARRIARQLRQPRPDRRDACLIA